MGRDGDGGDDERDEVTDENFEQLVVEASKERPVVVDLWAAWCGPCRVLGPILEKVAEEREAFLLAKVDVDAQGVGQALLQAVKSQGIPTVVGFRDGAAVDMFIGVPGARGERVRRPAPADRVGPRRPGGARGGDRGDLDDAEGKYREALDADEGNRAARSGSACILAQRGAATEARQTLMPLLPDPEAEGLLAGLEVASWAGLSEPERSPPRSGSRRRGSGARGSTARSARSATTRTHGRRCWRSSPSSARSTSSWPSTDGRWRTRCSETTGGGRSDGRRPRHDPRVVGPGLADV